MKNKSFILPSKLSTIFPVMVPEYIDIPVVLLAQKFIDNKLKRSEPHKKIYNYLFPSVAYSSFRTSFFVSYFFLHFVLRSSFGTSYSSFGQLFSFLFSIVVF